MAFLSNTEIGLHAEILHHHIRRKTAPSPTSSSRSFLSVCVCAWESHLRHHVLYPALWHRGTNIEQAIFWGKSGVIWPGSLTALNSQNRALKFQSAWTLSNPHLVHSPAMSARVRLNSSIPTSPKWSIVRSNCLGWIIKNKKQINKNVPICSPSGSEVEGASGRILSTYKESYLVDVTWQIQCRALSFFNMNQPLLQSCHSESWGLYHQTNTGAAKPASSEISVKSASSENCWETSENGICSYHISSSLISLHLAWQTFFSSEAKGNERKNPMFF